MNRTAVGYILVATAIVGAMLAFTNAHNYTPRAGLVWNMAHAGLFQRPDPYAYARTVTTADCNGPFIDQNGNPDALRLLACSPQQQAAARAHPVTYTMSLGTALTLCVVVGLAGVGLLVFGRKQ